MVYFESSTAAIFDPNEDTSSPYISDKSGNVLLKKDVHDFIDLYNTTLYRDIFFTADAAAQLQMAALRETPIVQ